MGKYQITRICPKEKKLALQIRIKRQGSGLRCDAPQQRSCREERSGSAKSMFLNNGVGEVGDMGEVELIITNTTGVIPYIDKTTAGTSFLRAQ